jgi:hypothetical protein
MEDPFGGPPHGTMHRQRSRPNLAHPIPAPPSSRSLNAELERSPSPPRRPRSPSPEITHNALRQHLSTLLEQKSSQLQILGNMGQEILKQQQELEERIRGFEDEGEDEVGDETKERLRELDSAMKAWESQNEGMMRELGGKVSLDKWTLLNEQSIVDKPTITVPEPSASSLTRRQRNAQHRALDMEFATEIGQNLLVEVRRLQALLSERDRALEKTAEEKESWDAEREGLLAAMRNAEGSVGEFCEGRPNAINHS